MADFDITLTAWGTWALVAVTIAAVIVGGFAARAANATFRLEAEPKLIVRAVGEANIFALDGMRRVTSSWMPGMPPTSEQIEWLDDAPVYVVTGRPGQDGRELVGNGFTIRRVSDQELHQKSQSPVWPSLRMEIRNVGRSPAIQAGLKWSIRGSLFSPDWRERFSEHGPEVVEKFDEATIVIDGVGPNDSAFIWLGNATGTHFTLTLKSPGYQRDPLRLESGLTTAIPTIAMETFALGMCSNSVSLPAS